MWCRGAQCAPVRFIGYARPRGRTMFATTATMRQDVGGGVPDAPADARNFRADIESAPTEKILAPEGSIGEEAKSVKKRAALLHVLAFCFFDHLFGVPRGA